MAFLHHHPRRTTRSQLSASPSAASLSQSAQSIRRGDTSTHLDRENGGEVQDWSVVFPGRSRVEVTASTSSAADAVSPFVLPSDEEADESNIELTLPHEQDGTGRFTRPSSPFYAADDEGESPEQEDEPEHPITLPRTLDAHTLDSNSDDDFALEELELTSSVFLSGSELGRRDSGVSHRQRRHSEWETGSAMSSSSWAWMNAESSRQSLLRERSKGGRHQSSLPVVFTSGSEGEEEDEQRGTKQRIREEEEAAFEDALANTHLAQSAGLAARAPKRRHRKNGESAKGSKRSTSSAVVASDLQASRRRAGIRSRRSAASNASARSSSRAKTSGKMNSEIAGKPIESRRQGLLSLVLRKLFSVEDDEVLQAFLRDEGPLRVQETSQTSLASDASSALKASSHDEVWSRNERNKQMRRLHHLQDQEAVEEEESDDESVSRILLRLPPRGMDSSQLFASPPHRVRLASHVGEPTLLEALQATVLSSLNNVPSGLSILLAGSRSARLVNYLAGRLAGQIGPSLTERMRKLIDDAEDDTAIQDEVFGRERSSSITRFRGGSHPAISSRSSTTLTSRGPDDTASHISSSQA